MTKKIKLTDMEREIAKGRVVFLLDREDIEWLSKHCCCSENATEEEKERCSRIRFRASAALHKSSNR